MKQNGRYKTMKDSHLTYYRAFIAFFVGICAYLKLCANKKHLCVIEHLCLEIPQNNATPPNIFRRTKPSVNNEKNKISRSIFL